jgi:uncharacterized protein (DUF302 family)
MALQTAPSPHDVRGTMDRAVAALERRGVHVFARVDHGGGARAAGLDLADEELLVFGDPRAGTPLMQSDATVGYELPLRLLVWDADGTTQVGYRPASELAQGYALAERGEALARMDQLLAALVADIAA